MAKKPMFTKSNPIAAGLMMERASKLAAERGSKLGKEPILNFENFMEGIATRGKKPARTVSRRTGVGGNAALGPNEEEEAIRAAAASAGINMKSGGPVTKKKSGGSTKKGYAKGGMVCRGMGAASRGGKFNIK